MLFVPLILLVLSIGLSRFALMRFEQAMALGSRHRMPSAQTAEEAVREFLEANGVEDVRIVEHTAMVSDYYDPTRRTLFLNRSTMLGTSAAAWAVALHEAAHALQEGDARKALEWRHGNVRLARYAPTLIGLLCAALAFSGRMHVRNALLICAVLCALIMAFSLMSMPVETNASQRVQAWMEEKLRKHHALLEVFTKLLERVAWRDTGALARSPLYVLFGLLPVGGKLRPR
ncbi:MAG: zinc metallopeptidase [Roseimicrobium sp.]